MNYQKVTSSNIEALAHEGTTLGVIFKNGNEYHYTGVERSVYEIIRDGTSVGKAFNTLVKAQPDRYPFARQQPISEAHLIK
jgi:hypothetical protein